MAKRTSRVAWGLAGVLICTSVTGVRTQAEDQNQDLAFPIWTYKDPWHRPLPRGLYRQTWVEPERARWTWVRGDDIAYVSLRMRSKAIQMLEKLSVVKLTVDEARAFTYQKLTVPKGKSPHLVRAVGLGEVFGDFSAAYRDDLLRIHYGCLGKGPLPMARHPLIIFLPTTPKQVFIDCSMIE